MKSNDILKEVNQLGLAEKIILVEDIWDSIAKYNSELPMPEWQKKELDKRHAEFKEGNLKLYDWENVHKELRNKNL
ncbi:addiction module protein [bacterium]|nr:addiction module protein [bacterium]